MTNTTPSMSARQRRVGKVLCLFTIVLAILDQNIVSAALVPIVRDLDPAHGVEHAPWLVAAFALGATVILPLYGRLCDVLGAKRIFLGAIATFLIGSALCGVAQSMGELIAFRAVQGIGAGGLMSVTMVVLAQLKDPDDPRGGGPGGLAGLMAGLGMGIGPLVGGLISDHASWRAIFYLNLPLGLIVIVGSLLVLRLPGPTGGASIDFPGAALAAAFAGSLLLVCEWGGKQYAWTSATIIGLGVAAVASLVLFLWRQATAAEPILPLSLFRVRAIRDSYLIQGLVGVAMMAVMVYLMLYLQVARGVSATSAATYIAFMAAGLVVSGLGGDRLGWSTRTSMMVGTACVTVALAALALTSITTPTWAIRTELVLLGAGFGQLLGKLIVVVQENAPARQLGVATTGIRFFQSLGGAIGAAVLGSLLTRIFEAKTSGLAVSAIAALPPAARHRALASFVSSIDVVFAVAALIMAVAFITAARLRPRTAATAAEQLVSA